MQLLSELVANRSVALVGNSQKILREKPARAIDSADIVIRINRGLPGVIDPTAIGERTNIWCAARYWPDLKVPQDCAIVCWMKLTQTGKKELVPMTQRASESGCPLVVWPQELEDACREFVGADPGTGIRILWFLRKVAQPRAVCCYGMDCWEAPSHWSGRMNTPNHSPSLEREAMLRLL